MGQSLYVLGPKHDPKDALAKVNFKSFLKGFWFTVKLRPKYVKMVKSKIRPLVVVIWAENVRGINWR